MDLVKDIDMENGRILYKTPEKGYYTNIVIPFSSAPFFLGQLKHGPPKTRLFGAVVFIPLLCYLLSNVCDVLHHGIVYICLKASWFPY